MSRFSVFKRKGQKYYYAQLKNPQTGKYLPAKSTKQTTRDEAILIVADWLKHGYTKNRDLSIDFTVDNIIYSIQNNSLTDQDAKKIIKVMQAKGLIESARVTGKGPETEKLLDFLSCFWSMCEINLIMELR